MYDLAICSHRRQFRPSSVAFPQPRSSFLPFSTLCAKALMPRLRKSCPEKQRRSVLVVSAKAVVLR